MKLKYKYGRCGGCGELVRLYSIDKCDNGDALFWYDCPNCRYCGVVKAIDPNIADTQEILSKFPDEKEDVENENDIIFDTDVSDLMDKLINIKNKYYDTVSQVELFTIGMNNLKTIIKKLIWREDLNTEEKDMIVNILKEDEEENE